MKAYDIFLLESLGYYFKYA